MLTPQQIEMRQHGVGASETAALLELSPYEGPLDVWCAKPTASRPPSKRKEDEDWSPAEVGSFLEDGIRALYQAKTGRALLAPKETFRHPRFPHVLASPDGLPLVGATDRRGLEIKLVGSRMVHHWAEDSVPDYVRIQCAQNMAVFDAPAWDVIALLGGTRAIVRTIERDAGLEEALVEAVEGFWSAYIEGDTPPPARTIEERERFLRDRYPAENVHNILGEASEEDLAELAELREVKAKIAPLEAREKELTVSICERLGNLRGLEGPWGKFLHYPVRGQPSWKDIAEELGGGAVPAETIERHRGEGHRVPRLYGPPKAKAPKTRKSR